MTPKARLIGAVAVGALTLIVLGYYVRVERARPPEVPVAGGDGGGLPLAQPADEHFDAAALERAAHDPAAAGLAALLVMRHGHLVFKRFAHGVGADTVVESGAFAQALVALLAGVAVQEGTVAQPALGRFDPARWSAAIERGTRSSYPQLLSRKIWARLNAAPAWITLPAVGAAVPADCCFHARVQDWMRVAGVLIDGGRFEGTQVVAARWVDRMRQPASADGRRGLGIELAAAAQGAEPFAADDAVFLRGPGHWRLWMAPSLHLAVLFGSAADTGTAAGNWDETRLPNLVINAVTDRTPSQKADSLLRQLVPQH